MNYLIGMGNYAMGDDGIGLRIVERVSETVVDATFEAIEVANNGMQLLSYFTEDTAKIVIVDAVKFGGAPGDHIVFDAEDVDTKKVESGLTTHEGDILKLIKMARDLKLHLPKIRILAIQPERMDPEAILSRALQNNFDDYVATALSELKP
jgi:hydrogenase maturation protease